MAAPTVSESDNARPGNAFPIIDAHQHFWDLSSGYRPWLNDAEPISFRYGDYSVLKQNFLPADYRRISADQQVHDTVHVETEWDPNDGLGETSWLQNLSEETGLPSAIVAQAWLHHTDANEQLEKLAAHALVRGVRHKPAAALSADTMVPRAPGSMTDPNWLDGYQALQRLGLSFDLQTPYWHLPEASRLAAEFPEIPLILNHTGLPADRTARGLDSWRRGMEDLAAHPNVAVKISGLGLPGQPWRAADNRNIVRKAIDLFGSSRVMFASNFPVDGVITGITREGFNTLFDGYKAMTVDFTAAERHAMFYGNAKRIYRITG